VPDYLGANCQFFIRVLPTWYGSSEKRTNQTSDMPDWSGMIFQEPVHDLLPVASAGDPMGAFISERALAWQQLRSQGTITFLNVDRDIVVD
jgi:hypothetical protein